MSEGTLTPAMTREEELEDHIRALGKAARAAVEVLEAEARKAEQALAAKDAEITAKDAEIAAKDARIAELEGALRFYADEWEVNISRLFDPDAPAPTTALMSDQGRRARQALGETNA